MDEFWKQTFLGNRLNDYLISLGLMAGLCLLIKVADWIVLARLKAIAEKTDNPYDDWLVGVLEKRGVPLLYLGAFYVGLKRLALSPLVLKLTNLGFGLVLAYLAVRLLSLMLEKALATYNRKKGGPQEQSPQAMKGLMGLARLVLWSLALLILLDNIGIRISALVAGLGIGGLAVAFAAQKILGDLFSYFSIFFDRPFEIGDFVVIDNFSGTVEHIGIKSTRIRSLSGEQLIFANADLTSSRLRNYKRMANRRVVFRFGLVYDTDIDKLERVPKLVEEIVKGISGATFERAHFASFGDYSLIFEVVYNVEGSDYLQYMEIQQRINLALMKALRREGLELAYPTQRVIMEK